MNSSEQRQTRSAPDPAADPLTPASQERLQLRQTQASLGVLERAITLLSAVNKPRRFVRAAMVFCNDLAAQWECERVSLGVVKGRYCRLKATSHSEHFTRKMQLIQAIESAMEECFDQDTEVLFPASAESIAIAKAAGVLSQQHGPSAVLSVPLHLDEGVQAVVTLERPAGKPFGPTTADAICLACNLCSSRLLNLRMQDRWFGAKWFDALSRALGYVLGARHTFTKLTCLLLTAFVLFAVFARGEYRTKSSCILEASVQQSICAPFDGYLKAVNIEVGDRVGPDTAPLAELDTVELRLQLASAKAQSHSHLKQRDAYMGAGEMAQAQIAQADADKTQAEIDLLNYRIGKAKLTSPFEGTVVLGDLKRQIGIPVQTGDVLFEVTPLESLRAQVFVSEDQILDISQGLTGALATASYPDQRVPFTVDRISPTAEIINSRNVFKVQVHLSATHDWMRPGMEGIAKIEVGKRRYVWIWTRKLVNWIRLKFWF